MTERARRSKGPLHQWSETFASEQLQFDLRFVCEDCVHFVEASCVCAHGYPNTLHRREAFNQNAVIFGTFCKEFELR